MHEQAKGACVESHHVAFADEFAGQYAVQAPLQRCEPIGAGEHRVTRRRDAPSASVDFRRRPSRRRRPWVFRSPVLKLPFRPNGVTACPRGGRSARAPSSSSCSIRAPVAITASAPRSACSPVSSALSVSVLVFAGWTVRYFTDDYVDEELAVAWREQLDGQDAELLTLRRESEASLAR